MTYAAAIAVEVLAGLGFTLAEGPVWDPGTRTVLWTDILAGQVWRCPLGGTPTLEVEHSEPVGAIALGRAGELVGMTPTGVWRLGAEPALIAANPEASPGLRANDAKPDPLGRFVGGTMGMPHPVPGAGTLWSFEAGTARPLVRGVTISNGLAWSDDGATMFFVDTPTRRIVAYDYDVSSGDVSEPRTVVEIDPSIGSPDGMAIDAEGGLWVAIWGGGRVHRYERGRLSAVIEVPADYPTCPAFAGDALDLLVITSATEAYGNGPAPPSAGSVFVATPGVSGAQVARLDLDRVARGGLRDPRSRHSL